METITVNGQTVPAYNGETLFTVKEIEVITEARQRLSQNALNSFETMMRDLHQTRIDDILNQEVIRDLKRTIKLP